MKKQASHYIVTSIWLIILLIGPIYPIFASGSVTSISIKVNPTPNTSIIGPSPICAGATAQYTTADQMSSYTWTVGGGTVTGASTVQAISVTWGAISPGSLSVYYTNNYGCVNTSTYTVALAPGYTFTANDKVCQNISYTWRGQTIPTNTAGSFTYFDHMQSQYGCDSVYVMNLAVMPQPMVALQYQTSTSGEAMVLSPVTLIATGGYDNYRFELNQAQLYNGVNNEVTTSSPLYYNKKTNQAKVEVTDFNGCTNIATNDFLLKVVIPNAFTPNSGYNDYFLKGYKIVIFNRYGHVLYQGTDGWDGRYKGQDMPMGTYYYKLELPVDENNTETFSGSVFLERY